MDGRPAGRKDEGKEAEEGRKAVTNMRKEKAVGRSE